MYVGEGEVISWRTSFFPKDQGQEESTPRVVGGKKNNKAHRRLGSTAPLASSVIISAWLGCLGNLHNTVLTPSLQLSITLPRSVRVHSLPRSPPSSLTFLRVQTSLSSSLDLCLSLLGWTRRRRSRSRSSSKKWISYHLCPSSTHRHVGNGEVPGPRWRKTWGLELPFCVMNSIAGVGGRELL